MYINGAPQCIYLLRHQTQCRNRNNFGLPYIILAEFNLQMQQNSD